MKIHSLATLSDWFYYFGTSGPQGVARMCELVAEAGISNLYLRTHDGGLANYPSLKSPPLVGRDIIEHAGQFASLPKAYHSYIQHLDFSVWDPIPAFLKSAPEFGLEAGLWFTIMEDDHGGPQKSDFLKSHPQLRCMDRQGEFVDGCLEFWFEEVREYKLAIIDELLDKGATRILLDLLRRNGRPSADANGFYHYGFNPEILDAFQQHSGLDARRLTPGSAQWQEWLEFVATPTTDFLIEVCRRIHSRNGCVELLAWPVHLKTWMAIDLEKILDAGPVEAVHVGSHAYSYSPADLSRQLAALKPQIGSRPVPIVPSISAYDGLVASGLDEFFAAAESQNVDSIVIHESEAILRNRMSTRFRALNFGFPHFKRALHSHQSSATDWSLSERYSGFLRGFNEDSLEADQLTEIQVAHTHDELHVRMTCHERDVAGLLPVPCWPADNYNVLQMGARLRWNPRESVHLFLSMPGQFNDFFHFLLDPSGAAGQECRLDEAWNGLWGHEVEIGEDSWTATFRLPFATLGLEPRKGQRIAFHALRAQASPAQVTMWNLAATNVLNPDEFGFLLLD